MIMKQCSRLDVFSTITNGTMLEPEPTMMMLGGMDCQKRKREVSECLSDIWNLNSSDLLSDVKDFGILDSKFPLPTDEHDFDILLKDMPQERSIEFTLDPPMCKSDIWNENDSLWNSGTINKETGNQILQMMSNDVNEIIHKDWEEAISRRTYTTSLSIYENGCGLDGSLESIETLLSSEISMDIDNITGSVSPQIKLEPEEQPLKIKIEPCSSGSSTSSGIESCSSSSCSMSGDEEDWNFQAFPELDEFSEDLFEEMKYVVHDDDQDQSTDTDDESEEVDILSVAEEIESSTTTFQPPTPNHTLSAQELKTLHSVKLVANDHCYCPQTVSQWVEAAENPARFASTVAKTKSSRCNARDTKRGGSRKVCTQVKRAGGRRADAVSRQGHRSSRNFTYNSREKREQLNQMERERRIGLKTCFEKLRAVVPELSSNPKASKDKILLLARSCINSVEQVYNERVRELQSLQRENDLLNRRIKSCRN